MIRFLAQLVARLFRRTTPSPKVTKPQITKHKQSSDQPAQKAPQQEPDKFWRDRLQSEDPRKAEFRARYRSRLEEQSPDLGQER